MCIRDSIICTRVFKYDTGQFTSVVQEAGELGILALAAAPSHGLGTQMNPDQGLGIGAAERLQHADLLCQLQLHVLRIQLHVCLQTQVEQMLSLIHI